MSAWVPNVIFALEGEWGDIRAVLVVVLGFTILVGSIYMLLWSNYGARQGYLILMVSLGALMIIFSVMWLFGVAGSPAGVGPRGPGPHWVSFKPDSAAAQDFAAEIATFPQGWDLPGQEYPGKIESIGETDTVGSDIRAALARDAAEKGLPADEPAHWAYRLGSAESVKPGEENLPVAEARFLQRGTRLLFGVRIPALSEAQAKVAQLAPHREVTVFAYREKGKVFLYPLYFLIVSILGFALHLWLLARYEIKHERTDEEDEPAPQTPATVG